MRLCDRLAVVSTVEIFAADMFVNMGHATESQDSNRFTEKSEIANATTGSH